ncbi:hypothetical protein [Dorea sp. D27]|uniref:hypothetical protein n=1 Tax=Dorea sp. D27 TaxID=658665 RepID=UPI000673A9EF|nr:hypothetical protein [Dorea sp. D27]KMZ53594.1 hypothetical protein HMPREF0980_02463 [Dorea sp. D27]
MNYSSLKNTYGDFQLPKAEVEVEGRSFDGRKAGMLIGNVYVDLSCGYEASEASFLISGCVDKKTGEYRLKELKPYILLGSYVLIRLGYSSGTKEVFRGFISRTEFLNEDGEPCVRVTAVDVKGIMMANSYARQLKARYVSDAVRELFDKPAYQELSAREIIKKLAIESTPDKNRGNADKNLVSMEMVTESDYEFAVRWAKRCGYEFFTTLGTVHFRKAWSDEKVYYKLGPGEGMTQYRISYDLGGLFGKAEIRCMEDGRGELVKAKKTMNNKLSLGHYAGKLVGQSEKVYIDSTLRSREEASERLAYLAGKAAYRFGTLECECVGIPELLPGQFMEVGGLGSPADNCFYVEEVQHSMDSAAGYRCRMKGRAVEIKG